MRNLLSNAKKYKYRIIGGFSGVILTNVLFIGSNYIGNGTYIPFVRDDITSYGVITKKYDYSFVNGCVNFIEKGASREITSGDEIYSDYTVNFDLSVQDISGYYRDVVNMGFSDNDISMELVDEIVRNFKNGEICNIVDKIKDDSVISDEVYLILENIEDFNYDASLETRIVDYNDFYVSMESFDDNLTDTFCYIICSAIAGFCGSVVGFLYDSTNYDFINNLEEDKYKKIKGKKRI